jgi:uncharacterized repeat protein (TIGR01451 family)
MHTELVDFGLRNSDFGLQREPIRNPQSAIRNRPHPPALPGWWRYTLVVLATLILCSCQAIDPGLALPQFSATKADAQNPVDAEQVVTDEPAEVEPTLGATAEVRELPATAADESIPSGIPSASPPWTAPVTGNCACCNPSVMACNACPEQRLVGPPDEYLCDGGDFGLPAAVRADWTVDGLEPEDAVAHYDTLDGRVVVAPSNRVCIYAPRFAAVRRVESLQAHERRQLIDVALEETTPSSSADAQPVVASTQRTGVAIDLGRQPAILFRGREQATEMAQAIAPGEFYNTLGPYANLEIVRSGQLDGSEQALVKRSVEAAVAWNGDQSAQVVFSNQQAVAVVGLKQPGIVYQTDEPGNPRLRLVKLASTGHALPGEEVEFTLRFDNIGDQTIGNVTVVDNLTTRLEYVANSAKSTVEAGFASVPNGAGSTVLRWEIKQPLKPSDGGVLQFKCRVR